MTVATIICGTMTSDGGAPRPPPSRGLLYYDPSAMKVGTKLTDLQLSTLSGEAVRWVNLERAHDLR